MSVNIFLQAITDGVAALPGKAAVDRETFYESLQDRLRRGVKQPERLLELQMQLDVAISSFETANYPPPRPAFSPPNGKPASAVHYVWLQIITGCGAISAVADVLKPIVDVQSGIAIGAIIVAVALTALLRVASKWRTLLLNLRMLCLGVSASMVGLFGIGVLFADAAPNGVLAEAIPGIVQFQDALDDIRKSSRQTAENTGILVEQSRKLTQAMDPVAQSKAAIGAAGYSVDEAGLVKAIKDGNTAVYYFQTAGVGLSAATLRDLLGGLDNTGITSIQTMIAYSSSDAKKVVTDEITLAATEIKKIGLNDAHDVVCKRVASSMAPWIIRILGASCDDEAMWITDLQTRSAYLGMGNLTYELPAYRPEAPKLVDAFDSSTTYPTARYVRVNLQYTLENGDLTLRDNDFTPLMTYSGLNDKTLIEQADCGAAACTGAVDFLYPANQAGSIVAITPHGPTDSQLLTPEQVAELPAEAIWGVGMIPYWNAMQDGAMVFIAGYDPKTRAALAAFCPLGANSSVRAEVNLAVNIDREDFAERMFRYVQDPSTRPLSFVFDLAREYPLGGGVSADGVYGVIPWGTFLNEMRDSNHAMIVIPKKGQTEISVRGFSAALKTFRKYSDCANP
jgi:hypothetical protein